MTMRVIPWKGLGIPEIFEWIDLTDMVIESSGWLMGGTD